MLRIAIIIGSTRPGRNGEAVARWVYEIAQKRSDAEFELVDIQDFNLPLLDEPVPPSLGQYTKEHTKAWAAKIDSFDAYIFVTPEYNHATSGALKSGFHSSRTSRTLASSSLLPSKSSPSTPCLNRSSPGAAR